MIKRVMPGFLTAFAAAVGTASVLAQQPQQCVNPDAVNGLVFLGRSTSKVEVTRGHPAFMSGFRAPAGFSLIGSGLRANGITTVAYKSSLASDKSWAALLAALAAEGWAVEAAAGAAPTFDVAGGPRDGTVCRGGDRRMVMVTETAGTTYATLYAYPQGATRRDCNAPEAPPRMGMELFNAAPRFQFPEGTRLGQRDGMGGGNSGEYTMTSRIISADTPARLVEHLAGQVAAQGWQQDAAWSDSGGAGATWRKAGEDGLTWGMLEIVRVSEGTYDVDFTMTSPR